MHLLLLVIILLAVSAHGMPPIAAEFYGNISLNGILQNSSVNITILDSDGVACGSQIAVSGSYGLLSCNGDDRSTGVDEGAVRGDMLFFYANSSPAGTAVWQEGIISPLNLSYVIVVSRPAAPLYFIAAAIAVLLLAVLAYLRRL